MAGDADPRRNARGAWILRIVQCKNLSRLVRHALLPQRGAADSIEAPRGGSTAAPLFVLGAFVAAFVGGGSPSWKSFWAIVFGLEFIRRVLGGFLEVLSLFLVSILRVLGG